MSTDDAELESCSAGQEENISPMIDTQIRLILVCSKVLRNFSEKLVGKFPHMSNTTALIRSAIMIYDLYGPKKQLQTVNTFHTVRTFRSVHQACI